MRVALYSWVVRVVMTREVESALSKMGTRIEFHLLRRSLGTWARWTSGRRDAERVGRRFFVNLVSREAFQLQTAWRIWTRRARMLQEGERGVWTLSRVVRGIGVRRGFGRWKVGMEMLKKQERGLKGILKLWSGGDAKRIRKAWKKWMEVVEEEERKVRVMRGVAEKMRSRALWQGWRKWVGWTRRQTREGLAAERRDTLMTRAVKACGRKLVLAGWKTWVGRVREWRAVERRRGESERVLRRAAKRLVLREKRMGWNSWVGLVDGERAAERSREEKERVLRRTVKRLGFRKKRMGWNAWRWHTTCLNSSSSAAEMRATFGAMGARMMEFTMTRISKRRMLKYFGIWKEGTLKRREIEAEREDLLHRAIARVASQIILGAFEKWCNIVGKEVDRERDIEQAIHMLDCLTVDRVEAKVRDLWGRWREAAGRRSRGLWLVRRTVSWYYSRNLSSSFRVWVGWVWGERLGEEKRSVEARAKAITKRLEGRGKRVAQIAEERALRALAGIGRGWGRRRMRGALNAWADNTVRWREALELATKGYGRGAVGMAFVKWRRKAGEITRAMGRVGDGDMVLQKMGLAIKRFEERQAGAAVRKLFGEWRGRARLLGKRERAGLRVLRMMRKGVVASGWRTWVGGVRKMREEEMNKVRENWVVRGGLMCFKPSNTLGS